MPVNSFDDHPLSWRPRRDAPGGGPVYLALAAQLADDIAAGLLPPGAKLPPQRELADYLDIDFTTVTRAYGVCRERGLIYGVTGRGTFVASPDAGGESSRTATGTARRVRSPQASHGWAGTESKRQRGGPRSSPARRARYRPRSCRSSEWATRSRRTSSPTRTSYASRVSHT